VGQTKGLHNREGGTLPWVMQTEGDDSVVGISTGVWYLRLAIVCINY
jgi:hypothetical protein